MNARRGSSATTTGLSLLVLVGFAAISVDVGMMVTARAQLHNAYDAAALGAVGYLNGEADGMQDALAFALAIAPQHTVFGSPVQLQAAEVLFGRIHPDNNMTWAPTNDPALANAVRINATNSSTGAAFARVFGITSLSVAVQSTAIKPPTEGASAVECFLPVSIPLCALTGQADDTVFQLDFGAATYDTAGWSMPGNTNPTPGTVHAQLSGACGGSTVSIPGTVALNNGQLASFYSNNNQSYLDALTNHGIPWATTKWGQDGTLAQPSAHPDSIVFPSGQWGQVIAGPIMIFDDGTAPGQPCGNVQFNQTKTIVKFLYGAVYDAISQGNTKGISVVIDTKNEYELGTAGGGPPDSSIRFQPPPALVE